MMPMNSNSSLLGVSSTTRTRTSSKTTTMLLISRWGIPLLVLVVYLVVIGEFRSGVSRGLMDLNGGPLGVGLIQEESNNNKSRKTQQGRVYQELPSLSKKSGEDSQQHQPNNNKVEPVSSKQQQQQLLPLPLIHLPITASNHVEEFQDSLDPTTEYDLTSFCVPWTTNSDEWWTHHPTWEISQENDTHYCFQLIPNEQKRKDYQDLYEIQFRGNCSNVLTKQAWSAGWTADFLNIVDGLSYAKKMGQQHPIQLEEREWHYAYPQRKRSTTTGIEACPRRNMFCYFLPISNCLPASDKAEIKDSFLNPVERRTTKFYKLYQFASRQQTWLRKRVYDFVKLHSRTIATTPCTVLHVRRGDVILHGLYARRYHAISEYMNASATIRPNIYLLTDDQNAIAEAKAEYPNYSWQHIDRPRFKASEGGWERQIPSEDATYEVTALLGEFELAKKCDQFIHTRSGFADMVYHAMASGEGKVVDHIDMDVNNKAVWNTNHNNSIAISKKYE